MADNVSLNPGVGGATIATDEIGGIQFQRVKLTLGADGVNGGDVSSSNPIPANIIAALPAGTNVIGALVANQSVNLTQIAGAALALGQAAMAASIPVVIASNQSTLNVQLQTGANVIGSLAANQSVNNTQINGSAIVTVATGVQKVGISDSAGANITLGQKTMSASLPVVISSDQSILSTNLSQIAGIVPVMKAASTAAAVADVSFVVALSPNSPLPTGSNTVGSIANITTAVVPGTGANHLGKADDTTHSVGDTGVMALAVRNDNPQGAMTTSTGDYSPMSVDQAGVVWTRKKQLTTYIAAFRLVDATAGRTALSFTFVANTNKQLATIYHPGTATKNVKILRISLHLISSSGNGAFDFEVRALNSTTAPATGNPAIVPARYNPAAAAAEATCLALPTTAGSLTAVNSPVSPSVGWSAGNSGNILDPSRAGQEIVLYEYSDASYMEPLLMRAGAAEGYAVNARCSTNLTLLFTVSIVFTEE